MKYRIFLFSLFLTLAACGPETKSRRAFEKLKQLEGKWISNNNIIFYESWKLIDDSTLSGSGYSLQDSDTVFSEVLILTLRDNKITYLARDPAQNRGQAIPFTLKTKHRNKFVFENLEHDYPNRIIYELEADSLLNIRLETAKGTKGTEFVLKRALGF